MSTSVLILDESKQYPRSQRVSTLNEPPNEPYTVIAELEARCPVGLPLPIIQVSMLRKAFWIGADAIIPIENVSESQQLELKYKQWSSGCKILPGGKHVVIRGNAIKYEKNLLDYIQPKIKKNSYGLGLGIPYGIEGLNLDVNVAPNLNLSGGLGTTRVAGIGYNFGFKYFFTPIDMTFRPRVSAYYGVHSVLVTHYIGIDKEDEGDRYTGLSLGIGVQWMWGKFKLGGLDFDIMYLATSNFDIDKLNAEGFDVGEKDKIEISIGFRYAF